ncbi:MAG: hypothetical protein ACE5IJ_01690 [Thermoplasmata archaeon]
MTLDAQELDVFGSVVSRITVHMVEVAPAPHSGLLICGLQLNDFPRQAEFFGFDPLRSLRNGHLGNREVALKCVTLGTAIPIIGISYRLAEGQFEPGEPRLEDCT